MSGGKPIDKSASPGAPDPTASIRALSETIQNHGCMTPKQREELRTEERLAEVIRQEYGAYSYQVAVCDVREIYAKTLLAHYPLCEVSPPPPGESSSIGRPVWTPPPPEEVVRFQYLCVTMLGLDMPCEGKLGPKSYRAMATIAEKPPFKDLIPRHPNGQLATTVERFCGIVLDRLSELRELACAKTGDPNVDRVKLAHYFGSTDVSENTEFSHPALDEEAYRAADPTTILQSPPKTPVRHEIDGWAYAEGSKAEELDLQPEIPEQDRHHKDSTEGDAHKPAGA